VDDISDASETAEDVIDGLDEDVQDIQDAQLPDIDIAPPPGECATHIHCPALRLCNDEGDCIEPPLCLSDADCDEGRVCDRGKCAATHTGCGSDADCVANGDCDLATNECVNKTSCESAADCVGESVCAGGDCVECAAAGDCPGGGLGCVGNQCQEADPCEEATDCLPQNACLGGICSEALLLADAHEDNDSPAYAGPLPLDSALNELTIQSWDDDWFTVTVPAAHGLLVRVSFDNSHGDLDLALHDASGAYLLDLDDRALPFAMTSAPTRNAPETYLLRVTQPVGTVSEYSLETFGVPKPFCANDSWDNASPNDGPATATVMEDAQFTVVGRRICPGDEDWFQITLADDDSTLGAILEYANSLGGLDVRLFDSLASPLSSVAASSSYEFAVAQDLPSATYYVAIDGEDANTANSYSVSSLFFPPGACFFDTYELNDKAIAAPWFEGTNNQLALCTGDVDWYTTDVPAGKGLISKLQYNNVQSQLQIDLFNSEDFTLVDGDLGLIAPAGNKTQTALYEGGPSEQTILTRVTRLSPAGFDSFTPYTLDVEVVDAFCNDDDAEENDSPSSATLAKTLFGVKNFGKICPGDSDWYQVELALGDVLSIDLAQAGGVPLGLHLFQTDASTPVDVETTVFGTLGSTATLNTADTPGFNAGVHYVLITGNAPTAYTLTTHLASPDAFCEDDAAEPNDTLFTSAELDIEAPPAVGAFCPNNPDVFHFQGGGATDLELTVTTPPENPKVVVTWTSPDLNMSQGWILGAGGGTVSLPANEDGIHFIELHSPVASEFTVSLTTP